MDLSTAAQAYGGLIGLGVRLGLEADICTGEARDVRYGPETDMALAAGEAFGGRAADTGRRAVN